MKVSGINVTRPPPQGAARGAVFLLRLLGVKHLSTTVDFSYII